MKPIDVDKYMRHAIACGNVTIDDGLFRVQQLRAAVEAAQNAYCPYSNFQVGAAVLTDTLSVHAGCNVENAMFNGMSHAELTAITAAIMFRGHDMKIQEMTIWTPTATPTTSCGGCRQLIREHALNQSVKVWSYCLDPAVPPQVMTIEEMLPNSFGPECLS